jgi:hypothetical protein
MTIEVALIDSDARRGVRLLGRSADSDLVEAVREHLVDQLQRRTDSEPPQLHLVGPANHVEERRSTGEPAERAKAGEANP